MSVSPSRISRRQALSVLGALVFGAMLALWLRSLSARRALVRLRAAFDRLEPVLLRTPTGTLSPEALEILQAATATLVDVRLEMTHYTAYLTWRSENLPGYHRLYEEFARWVDGAALRVVGLPFVRCDAVARRTVLRGIDLNRGRIRSLLVALADRDWIRFEKFFVREILALFVRTDGWVLLGYPSWPGTPRGLDDYTKVPAARPEAA